MMDKWDHMLWGGFAVLACMAFFPYMWWLVIPLALSGTTDFEECLLYSERYNHAR